MVFSRFLYISTSLISLLSAELVQAMLSENYDEEKSPGAFSRTSFSQEGDLTVPVKTANLPQDILEEQDLALSSEPTAARGSSIDTGSFFQQHIKDAEEIFSQLITSNSRR